MKIKVMRKYIAIGMVVFLVISGTTMFLIMNDKSDNSKKNESYNPELSISQKTEDEKTNDLKELGYTEDEIDSMDEKNKDKIIMGNEYFYEDGLMRLYSDRKNATEWDGDADKLYRELIDLMSSYEFHSVVSKVQSITALYNLTKGDNLKIAAIYADASMMTRFSELDKENKEIVLQGHRDINALIADTIYAYVRRREAVILDMNSATPILTTSFKIGETTEIEYGTDDYVYYAQFWNRNLGGIRKMYRIETDFPETNNMYAIVLQGTDGTLRIAGFYGDTAKKYMTVGERKEMGLDKD